MKLVRIKSEYYLVDYKPNQLAMHLPNQTQVLCLDEMHTGEPGECLRKSSPNDHCYGCQELIASTDENYAIKGLLDRSQIRELLDKLYAKEGLKIENFIKQFTLQDMYNMYINGTKDAGYKSTKAGFDVQIWKNYPHVFLFTVTIEQDSEGNPVLNDGKINILTISQD